MEQSNLIELNHVMEVTSRVLKILKINWIRNYKISCMFSDGQSRIIEFKKFFNVKKIKNPSHPINKLLLNQEEFSKVKIIGNSIGWENIGINSTDEEGRDLFLPFHLDPIVLFQNSILDEEENFDLGKFIKNERKKAGLTQEKLAKRIGTNKAYISKIENNNTDIEFLTLYKIIKAGFRKEFNIQLGLETKPYIIREEVIISSEADILQKKMSNKDQIEDSTKVIEKKK